MDHGHKGHDSPMCSMNMLFTWDTNNLCIIFKSWRVHNTASLIGALVGVILLTAGYELVRELARRYEARSERRIEALHSEQLFLSEGDPDNEPRSFPWLGRSVVQEEKKAKLVKGLFYAVQVFYSFFIMLLFMTYNGWVMLAVAVGAFLGYMAFASSSSTKSVACH
ncbi:Ctr copper transporter [Eremomyces bilateralis CBS 781.70]|uniref:Copper transport protein n=1 Tax=Eremomyces bilateralis CBS 781.70 TaxID=1392243 RepID=A0A6G1G7F8_9PEZI|nr:Ctr copper transporter [Eremomyces bilateralis CBS 781.70]KAF1814025.1 Ctr copper transporter [Eremomyces bilateralis CBS 781.70]